MEKTNIGFFHILDERILFSHFEYPIKLPMSMNRHLNKYKIILFSA